LDYIYKIDFYKNNFETIISQGFVEEIKIISNGIIDILNYCSNENATKSNLNYFYSNNKILLSFFDKILRNKTYFYYESLLILKDLDKNLNNYFCNLFGDKLKLKTFLLYFRYMIRQICMLSTIFSNSQNSNVRSNGITVNVSDFSINKELDINNINFEINGKGIINEYSNHFFDTNKIVRNIDEFSIKHIEYDNSSKKIPIKEDFFNLDIINENNDLYNESNLSKNTKDFYLFNETNLSNNSKLNNFFTINKEYERNSKSYQKLNISQIQNASKNSYKSETINSDCIHQSKMNEIKEMIFDKTNNYELQNIQEFLIDIFNFLEILVRIIDCNECISTFIEIFNTSFAYLNNQIIGNMRNYISDTNLNNEDFEILLCEFNYPNFETHNWKIKDLKSLSNLLNLVIDLKMKISKIVKFLLMKKFIKVDVDYFQSYYYFLFFDENTFAFDKIRLIFLIFSFINEYEKSHLLLNRSNIDYFLIDYFNCINIYEIIQISKNVTEYDQRNLTFNTMISEIIKILNSNNHDYSCKTDILNYISKKNLSYESINNYFQKKENKNLLNCKSLMYLFDHCKNHLSQGKINYCYSLIIFLLNIQKFDKNCINNPIDFSKMMVIIFQSITNLLLDIISYNSISIVNLTKNIVLESNNQNYVKSNHQVFSESMKIYEFVLNNFDENLPLNIYKLLNVFSSFLNEILSKNPIFYEIALNFLIKFNEMSHIKLNILKMINKYDLIGLNLNLNLSAIKFNDLTYEFMFIHIFVHSLKTIYLKENDNRLDSLILQMEDVYSVFDFLVPFVSLIDTNKNIFDNNFRLYCSKNGIFSNHTNRKRKDKYTMLEHYFSLIKYIELLKNEKLRNVNFHNNTLDLETKTLFSNLSTNSNNYEKAISLENLIKKLPIKDDVFSSIYLDMKAKNNEDLFNEFLLKHNHYCLHYVNCKCMKNDKVDKIKNQENQSNYYDNLFKLDFNLREKESSIEKIIKSLIFELCSETIFNLLISLYDSILKGKFSFIKDIKSIISSIENDLKRKM
jgi:hypothetical protein